MHLCWVMDLMLDSIIGKHVVLDLTIPSIDYGSEGRLSLVDSCINVVVWL